jgi:signal transduction histidine kinase
MKSVSKRLRILDELSVSGRQRSELFDLGELIQDLKEGHSAQFKRHGLEFNFARPSKPLRVRLVKGMVVQILENLISNSLYWTEMRAGRESRYVPTIWVELETNPPAVRFRDNGRGISSEHRDRIFRPFWSLKEKSKRRGLGLFIARENANYLGGQLMLSDRMDKETGRLHEFVLELPLSAADK